MIEKDPFRSLTPVQQSQIRANLFRLMDYKIYHPEVARFHQSGARTKVVSAARRTTKSYAAAHDIMPDLILPNKRFWVVGPNYGLAEKEFSYIHQELVLGRRRIPGMAKPKVCHTSVRSGALYIEWPNGSILEGKSADNPESLLGEAVDGIIYAEAAQLKREIREKYCLPTLNTKKGREIVPTTPESKAEWVYDLVQAGESGKFPWIESFAWDGAANPLYDWEYHDQMKALLGEDNPVFREQFLGEWVFYGGRVYPQFNQETHVIEPFAIPKHWPKIRGIDFGHRDPFVCYDDKTEVLTKRGWKLFKNIGGEEVATVNDDKTLNWQTPTDHISQHYIGDMVISEPIKGGVNFCVTPNHQMVVEQSKTGKWKRVPASDLRKGDFSIPTGYDAPPEFQDEMFNIPHRKHSHKILSAMKTDIARFIGLWVGDGCVTSNKYVRIAQKNKVKEVRNVLSALGWKWSECTNKKNGVIDFSIGSGSFASFITDNGGYDENKEKRIPSFIFDWGVNAHLAFMEGLKLGDWCSAIIVDGKRQNSDRYLTTSKGLADDVQAIASMVGLPTTIKSGKPKKTEYSKGKIIMHVVSFVQARKSSVRKLPIANKHYDGMIYCVTVPNGTLVVRRGGKPMVCGNCLWAAVGPEGEIYIYREYYKRGGVTREHADYIKEKTRDEKIKYTVADRSATQLIADLTYEGIRGIVPSNSEHESGRQAVANFLLPTSKGTPPYPAKRISVDEKRPKLYLFDTCHETIREFKFYRWAEASDTHRQGAKEKTEGDDHAVDVIRYILRSRPSPFKARPRLVRGSMAAEMASLQRKPGRFIGR